MAQLTLYNMYNIRSNNETTSIVVQKSIYINIVYKPLGTLIRP